ncbi:hypothetical protein GGS24DRAFT_474442 [Hypoxylon argillaceum]|nr:hypothetical protein GGS24DRAFT_474442 [Hypoxylon argillaceum]KAI1150665.1 hypothetical protein F4825DRAFT_425732 [Nemania diffusa]
MLTGTLVFRIVFLVGALSSAYVAAQETSFHISGIGVVSSTFLTSFPLLFYPR